MKKVISFARVSTVQQDLTGQLEAVKRCAIQDGYNENEIVEVTGKESAIKLAEEERITLAEIKKLVTEYPQIESIYFFAVDRLARRMSVVMSVKEWADENKINLVFMNPHRMSTFRRNENGVLVEDELTTLMLAMLSYGAAMEMKIKQARFATAKATMKAQGKMISGKPIKGYMLAQDKTILVNEDEARFIRDIFDEYLNGNNESLRSLHDKYVVKGFFATPKTNYTTLAKTRMHNILTDCAYCGRSKELKKKQKDDGSYKITTMQYPAIITEELFDAVQDKLQQRKSQPKRILENIYFAKGKIFCGECGNAMRTDTWNMVYKCSDKKNHKIGINMNAVDAVTWLTTKQVYGIYSRMSQEENRANYEEYITNYVNKLKIINNQIDDKYKIIDRTNERYVLGKIKETMADRIIGECNQAIIQWNKDKISIQQSINNYKKLIAAIDGETKVPTTAYDNFTDAEKKEIIDKMITAIRVIKVEKNLYNIYIDSIINTSKIEYYQYHSNKHTLVGINGEETVDFGYLLEEQRHIAMRNKKQ